MPRGALNWNYKEVVSVLKDHGFTLRHIEGSHHYFIATVNGIMRQVCVPFHGKKTFRPRTLNSMIRQSGLTKKEWGF